MTNRERKKFMRELTANILNEALAMSAKMPDDWDGHELRRYLADKFEASVMTLGRMKGYRQRYREYRNTCIVQNL